MLIDPNEQESELKLWRGADANIWGFHSSFKRLAIFLSNKTSFDGLYIVGIGCEHICAPIRWKAANITIVTEPPNQSGEVRRRIIDSDAGFELRCSDVVIMRGRGAVAPDPFDRILEGPKGIIT